MSNLFLEKQKPPFEEAFVKRCGYWLGDVSFTPKGNLDSHNLSHEYRNTNNRYHTTEVFIKCQAQPRFSEQIGPIPDSTDSGVVNVRPQQQHFPACWME
jgi:hypothetical protein